MFAIFESPKDYPGKFVLRGFDMIDGEPNPRPHAVHIVCDKLEEARSAVPAGLVCLPRWSRDEGQVVETWL